MNIKLNNTPKTEDELDMEAFEKDVALFDYLDRVEKGQLTPEEKKGREELYNSIGFKPEGKNE
jgi:hypothetical protein